MANRCLGTQIFAGICERVAYRVSGRTLSRMQGQVECCQAACLLGALQIGEGTWRCISEEFVMFGDLLGRTEMRKTIPLLMALMTVVSAFALTPASAADAPKLAAPVYPGAVSAVPAEGAEANEPYVATFGDIKTLDCRGSRSSTKFKAGPLNEYDRLNADARLGPWCFLTRDPIDKVKAFYEKSIGSMRPVQAENGAHGYLAYLERAWFDDTGCDGGKCSGFLYSGISVHALPPPPVKGQTPLPATYGEGIPGQEDYLFYAQFKHLGLFHQSVAWYGPEPGKHEVADLEAVAKKYGYLESAFFQHKGPELQPVDVTLEKRYSELQGQRMEAAMMAPMSARTKLSKDRMQAGMAEESGPNAEFNSIMQRNPELARRYVALTQKLMSLMQQGKFDEADEVADEIDELEQNYPELVALNNQEQARSDSISKAAGAEEDAIEAAGNKQMEEALWPTAVEYIEAVDKEDYYTLIVIDNTLTGYEKDYSRDRAVVDAATADRVDISGTNSFGITYKQSFGDPGSAAANEPPPEEKKDDLKEEAKKLLKKWKPF